MDIDLSSSDINSPTNSDIIIQHVTNIKILTYLKNKKRSALNLAYDNGDITKLLQYFAECIYIKLFDFSI